MKQIKFYALVLLGIMLSINQVWGASTTITFNTDAGISALGITKPAASAGTNIGSSYNVGDVTMAYTKNGAGTDCRVWNSSGTLDLRIYAKSILTFSVPTGYHLESISFTGSAVNTNFTAPTGVGSWNTGTWSAGAATNITSVALTCSTNAKINTITITYGSSTTYTDYLTECAEPTACATPTFSPAAGNYATGAQSVTISCTTDGAAIHYTTDGTTPTSSSTTYSSAINVNQDMTIKAIAVKGGLTNSEVAEATYTITYPVSFNLNGKSGSIATQNISYNGTASEPATPEVTGYTFGGWYTEAGCTNAYNFSTGVTAAKELFAKWTATEYAITYNNLNGATNSNPDTYTIETATIALADPGARDGFVFDGWYTGSNGAGDKVTEIALGSTGAKILYANWKASYTITWMCSGSTHTTTNVIQGEGLAMPSTDIDLSTTCGDGYVVRGWTKATSVNADGTSIVYAANGDAVSGSETYYAVIAKQEGDASEDFVITTTSLANGDYVIGYQYNSGDKIVMSNQTRGTNSEYFTAIQKTPTGSPLKYTKDADYINDARIWTITKHATENTYSIKNKNNGKYVNMSTTALSFGNTPQYFNITWDNTNSRWLIESTTNSGYYLVGYVSGSTYYFQSKQGSLGTGYKISLFKSANSATYSDYRLVCCVKMAAPASLNSTPTEDGATISWGSVTGASGYEVKIDGGAWTSVGTNTSYTITGKECGGATVTWQVRATCNTGDYCEEGIACAEQNFQTLACTCPSFSFHWNNGTEWTKDCFTFVEDHAWGKGGLTIPASTDKEYWVGKQEKYACESCELKKLNNENAVSENVAFKYMPIAYLQENSCAGEGDNLKHAMAGAYGSVRIYDNSGSNNLYAGFIPAGYLLRMGTNGQSDWTSTNFTTQNTTAVTYETDLVTIGSADAGKNIYVGLWTAATFNAADGGATVNNWTNGYAISDCKVSNGHADQYGSWGTLGTLTENKTGKFRFWYNNGSYNGDLHFVPYYNVTFKRGDDVLSTTELKSCEVANVVNLTAPSLGSEETFDGWYEDAGLTVKFDGATYDASANGSKTFYAKVSTRTYSITLNAGTGTVDGESHFDFAKGAQTLPVAVPCDAAVANGWSFAGWAAASVGTQTTTKPSGLVEPVAGSCSYTVADDAELFAVYTKNASAPIGYNIKFTTSGGTTYYVSGGVSSKTMAINTNKANAALFEIEHVGDDVATALVRNNNGSKSYIYLNSSGATNGDLSEQATTAPSTKNYLWKVTNTSVTNAGATTRCLAGRIGVGTTSSAVVNCATSTVGTTVSGTGTYYAIALEEVTGDSYVYLSNPSCADMYTVAVSAADGGSAEATPASASAGQTVRLTATAGSSCYTFTSWTIKKTSDESDITSSVSLSGQTESATFTMPAYGVTVVPTFTKKQFEVRLHNGDNVTTEIVDCGDTYVFESVETGCSDVQFEGWTATAPNGSHTWASTPVVAANTGAVNAAKDYYAVFGKSEGATVTYNRISTLADADMGESFVIGYNDGSTKKALKGKLISTGDAYTSVNSSETANKITPGADDWKWIITKVGANYAIRNVSTGKYLTVNGADLGESNSVYADWTITFSGENARISSNGEYIMHTVSGGTNMFAAHYEAPTNIYLYKRTASLVYSSLNDCGGYHDIILNTIGEGSLVYTTPVGSAKTGATVTISNGAATGYKMSSQVVSADCGTVEVTDNQFTMPDCDVTITTYFRQYYTIRYNQGTAPAAGASITGSNTSTEKWQGATVTLKSSQFNCGGYTLAGWATEDGGEMVYELGASYNEDADLTLYPVWEAKTDKYIDEMHGTTNYTGAGREMSGYYTIPILEDDDSGSTECKTTHKKFIGWIATSNKAADGTIADAKVSSIFAGGAGKAATNATYYAVWAVVNE